MGGLNISPEAWRQINEAVAQQQQQEQQRYAAQQAAQQAARNVGAYNEGVASGGYNYVPNAPNPNGGTGVWVRAGGGEVMYDNPRNNGYSGQIGIDKSANLGSFDEVDRYSGLGGNPVGATSGYRGTGSTQAPVGSSIEAGGAPQTWQNYLNQGQKSAQPVGQPVQYGGAGGASGPGGSGATSTQQSATPFDASYAQRLRDLQAQQAQINSQQESGQRQIDTQFASANRDLTTAKDKAAAMLQARMADQGIVRSGINIGAQEEQGQQYAQQTADLATARAQSLEQLLQNITGARQGVLNQMSDLEFQRAQDTVKYQLDQALQQAQAAGAQQYAQQVQQQQQSIINQTQPMRAPDGSMIPMSWTGQSFQDQLTGRTAYYGPQGQPASPYSGGPVPAGYQVSTMPNGQQVYYNPNSWAYADPNRPQAARVNLY